MKESFVLRFLYHTVPGRAVLKLLVHPWVSKLGGLALSSCASRWLVPYYIKKYHIDMTACEKCMFSSFNDFFIRKKAYTVCKEAHAVVSPCDGFLSVYRVDDSCSVEIKHRNYTMEELLRSKKLAGRFRGGYCLVFRLEPRHYHRYIYAADAVGIGHRVLPGILHCVRPIACSRYPVYTENSREYVVLSGGDAGIMVQMEVGALMVGKICNHRCGKQIRRGQEKGYFAFGGSTIVLLLQDGAVDLCEDAVRVCGSDTEIPVQIGERIGTGKVRSGGRPV